MLSQRNLAMQSLLLIFWLCPHLSLAKDPVQVLDLENTFDVGSSCEKPDPRFNDGSTYTDAVTLMYEDDKVLLDTGKWIMEGVPDPLLTQYHNDVYLGSPSNTGDKSQIDSAKTLVGSTQALCNKRETNPYHIWIAKIHGKKNYGQHPSHARDIAHPLVLPSSGFRQLFCTIRKARKSNMGTSE